jgi:hypothetical protein
MSLCHHHPLTSLLFSSPVLRTPPAPSCFSHGQEFPVTRWKNKVCTKLSRSEFSRRPRISSRCSLQNTQKASAPIICLVSLPVCTLRHRNQPRSIHFCGMTALRSTFSAVVVGSRWSNEAVAASNRESFLKGGLPICDQRAHKWGDGRVRREVERGKPPISLSL